VFPRQPRQADLMIVAGSLSYKMAERTKLLYDQMAEPNTCWPWVLRDCGGLFQCSYAVVNGRGQDHSGGCVRSRLPASARSAD